MDPYHSQGFLTYWILLGVTPVTVDHPPVSTIDSPTPSHVASQHRQSENTSFSDQKAYKNQSESSLNLNLDCLNCLNYAKKLQHPHFAGEHLYLLCGGFLK